MTLFVEFADLISRDRDKEAISLWLSEKHSLMREYRAAASDEEGTKWSSGKYNIFEYMYKKLRDGDQRAKGTLKELIDAGFMLNEPDRYGMTLFLMLVAVGDIELLHFAVRRGASVNGGEAPPLSWVFNPKCLLQKWREVADFLIANGALVNVKNLQEPPLYQAIRWNHREAMEYLFDKGANPNIVRVTDSINTSGTALHYCLSAAFSYETDVETARSLLRHGGDPTIKNKEGFGAIDAFFASDRQPNDNLMKIVELFSSTDSWQKASWYLNMVPPSSYNPSRRRPASRPEMEHTSSEHTGVDVTFRVGDKVKIHRRGGYKGFCGSSMNLTDPATRVSFRGEYKPIPGTTGVIVGCDTDPRRTHWKAVVDFNPGVWEVAENYGALQLLGHCRGSVFPVEVLEIIEPANEPDIGNNFFGNLASRSSIWLFRNWGFLVAGVVIVLLILLLNDIGGSSRRGVLLPH